MDEHRRRLERRLGDRAPSEIDEGTIVVLPSISFPTSELRKIVGIEHYEERLLFLLLLLRKPGVRIVFISSVEVPDAVVDYYLGFLDDPASARERLHMIAIGDRAPRALTEKLLERPELLDRVSDALTEPENTFMLTFNVTGLEFAIADKLGVLLYGPHPDLVPLGSKSGSRKVARMAGVDVLVGSEDLFSIDQLNGALHELKAQRPDARSAVVKLNNGFSGQGNAIVDLGSFTGSVVETATVFCASEESWPSFGRKIETEGAIVEELLRAPGVTSPSVQLRVMPDGSTEVISTHDQILGGPDDQVYLGCRFPASPAYRDSIQVAGRKVAAALASRGVVGSFGIDFVVSPGGAAYLSEINLRLGGTTHPFLMARLVTQGVYTGDGELVVDGQPRNYIATDNLKSDAYKGLDAQRVIDAVRAAGLNYDESTHTGVLLHLLSALPRYGKLGAVCVAASLDDAQGLLDRLMELLDRLALTA
jgi:hypothetical protein